MSIDVAYARCVGEPPVDPFDPNAFVTVWETTTASESIYFPIAVGVNVDIDWGDGSAIETVTSNFPTHVYADAGEHTVIVLGTADFYGTTSTSQAKCIDILQWGDIGVYDWENAFYGAGLTVVSVTDTLMGATDAKSMFRNCTSLTFIEAGTIDASILTRMHGMFQGCTALVNLDYTGIDTTGITPDATIMFGGCTNLVSVSFSGGNFTPSTTNFMFQDCTNFTSLDEDSINMSLTLGVAFMFQNCTSLISVDLTSWDLSSMTNIQSICQGCTSITTVNMTGWDVSNVNLFDNMFNGCVSLVTLDVAHFRPSSATIFDYMFNGCVLLSSIDLSAWGTVPANRFNYMFGGCTTITSMDLSGLTLTSVLGIQLNFMFSGCTSLSTINSTGLDTSEVTTMQGTFQGGTVFDHDVSNWDVSKVTTMANMFDGSNFSDTNYDLALDAWSLLTVQSGVFFHAGSAQYTSVTERLVLTDAPNNWIITDGGPL